MAKYLDKETQSIAATVSDVLEGKAPKKEEKKDKKEAKKAVKEVEQPKAPDGKNGPQTGEVDFKAKHKVKKSGKKLDGSDVKEDSAEDKEVEELTDKQKKYQEFFQKALKRFKVDSPAELDKEGRKKFFDYVDKNYDAGDNESD